MLDVRFTREQAHTGIGQMLNRPKKVNVPGGNCYHHKMTSPQPPALILVTFLVHGLNGALFM
jgi:hypothetical protein